MASIVERVQRLLDLLDLVEKTFDPAAIERQLGLLLCNRLQEVADLLRSHYPDEGEVDRADGDSAGNSATGAETAPPVRVVCKEENRGAETASPVRVVWKEENRGAETAPPVRVVCKEENRGAETAPPVGVVCKEENRGADTTTASPSADVIIVESPQTGGLFSAQQLSSQPIEISPSPPSSSLPSSPSHPSPVNQQQLSSQPQSRPQQFANQQQSYAEIYRETLTSPQPPEEEPALKRRRLEAEAIVKKAQKPKTYACGVSYQDGLKERDFSNRVKRQIQDKLPDLSTHKRLFHYMVFATLDRLNCNHCSECPNHPDT